MICLNGLGHREREQAGLFRGESHPSQRKRRGRPNGIASGSRLGHRTAITRVDSKALRGLGSGRERRARHLGSSLLRRLEMDAPAKEEPEREQSEQVERRGELL